MARTAGDAAGVGGSPFGLKAGLNIKRIRLTNSQKVACVALVMDVGNMILHHAGMYHLTADEVGLLTIIVAGCRSLLTHNSGGPGDPKAGGAS